MRNGTAGSRGYQRCRCKTKCVNNSVISAQVCRAPKTTMRRYS